MFVDPVAGALLGVLIVWGIGILLVSGLRIRIVPKEKKREED
jgi:hypothetical protein